MTMISTNELNITTLNAALEGAIHDDSKTLGFVYVKKQNRSILDSIIEGAGFGPALVYDGDTALHFPIQVFDISEKTKFRQEAFSRYCQSGHLKAGVNPDEFWDKPWECREFCDFIEDAWDADYAIASVNTFASECRRVRV